MPEYIITVKVFCDGKRCVGSPNIEQCKECFLKYGLNGFQAWKIESVVPTEKRWIVKNVRQALELTLAVLQKHGFRVGSIKKILGGRRIIINGIIKPFEYPQKYVKFKAYLTLYRNPFWSFPKWLRDNKPEAPEEDFAPAVTINYSLLQQACKDNVNYLIYVTEDGKILAVSPKQWYRVYAQKKGYIRKIPLKTKKKYELVAHIPVTVLKPLEEELRYIEKEIKYMIEEEEKNEKN